MADPNTILFSMPTLAGDELTFAVPTRESFEGAPLFHEDEWAQLEFFPASRLDEVQKLLSEYKLFESRHRVRYGWTDVYVRRIRRHPFLAGSSAGSLAALVGASVLPSPILTTSAQPLGQVESGFSLGLPGGVLLYGLGDSSGCSLLAASVEQGGDNGQLTRAFSAIHQKHGLVLVDWRAQMVLVSVAELGGINLWRP